jgi:hypothetical protein
MELAEDGIAVIAYFPYPSLWYESCQKGGVLFPSCACIPTGFLFSKLQNSSEVNIFQIFAESPSRATPDGCYIVFSEFSTARANLAQECFLNRTCVTASTAAHRRRKTRDRRYSGHIQKTGNKQGFHSWHRYSIAAPTPWLARAWC